MSAYDNRIFAYCVSTLCAPSKKTEYCVPKEEGGLPLRWCVLRFSIYCDPVNLREAQLKVEHRDLQCTWEYYCCTSCLPYSIKLQHRTKLMQANYKIMQTCTQVVFLVKCTYEFTFQTNATFGHLFIQAYMKPLNWSTN